MRAVGRNLEPRIELEGISSDMMTVAVVDVDPVLGHLDPEIRVADGARGFRDLRGRDRERLAIAQAREPAIDADGQAAERLGGMHDAARAVGLADRSAAVRALLHHQHIRDAELGDDAE